MEKDEWKLKYSKLRKKYQDLRNEFNRLKVYCEKLKENNEIDLGQIKFLRKENEYLKSKFKKTHKKKKTSEDSSQLSSIDESLSHYFIIPTSKIEKTTQANPDQEICPEASPAYIYQGFFIIGPHLSLFKEKTPASPEILYEYYPANYLINANAKSLIPQLCFPQQIRIEKAKCRDDTTSQIKHLIHQKRSQKHFILTLRNETICSKLKRVKKIRFFSF